MVASRSQEIEGLITMFAQASQMVATARSSGRYWLDKIDVQLELDDPYEDIEGAARAPSDGTSTESALEQVRYWRDVLDTYSGHVDVSRERLADLSAIILNDDGSAGPLEEVLFGTSPGSLLLDEYQVELLRAQAVAEYWERQLTIAEAVDRYARDTSSARATEAETEASYREALELYSARKADYDRAVEMLGQLDAAGSSTEEARRAVEVASSALEDARLHRDVACEIHEYASNGYLGASGDSAGSTGTWRSPEEQLQFARNGYERARAALAVLRNVVADSQSERGSGDLQYIQSRNAYQAALERYLALRRQQGALLEEISRQGAAVEQAQDELGAIARRIAMAGSLPYASSDPQITAETLEGLLDPSDGGNRYNRFAFAYFGTLEPGQGLRLSYDTESFVLRRNPDWEDLRSYTSADTGDSSRR